MALINDIDKKLEQAFPGATIEIEDQSANHIEHEPVGIHIGVRIIYSGFKGKSLIEQHRMVQDVLKEELKGAVHALQLVTKAEE